MLGRLAQFPIYKSDYTRARNLATVSKRLPRINRKFKYFSKLTKIEKSLRDEFCDVLIILVFVVRSSISLESLTRER